MPGARSAASLRGRGRRSRRARALAAGRAHADPAPAGRAHALLARLRLSTLEGDLDLSAADRLRLIEAIDFDIATSLAQYERCGMVTPRLEPLWIRGQLARAKGDRLGAYEHSYA